MNMLDIKRRIISDPDTGCWNWTGAHLKSGYGSVRYDGRNQVLHRVMWEIANGPIEPGLQLDHLCRNRGCCNPVHLEPVPQAVNLRRGQGFSGLNAQKDACPRGHAYDLVDKRGYRDCSTCKRERRRRHYLKERADLALLTGTRP